jgi:ABC-type branched-subunit amino acid transport system substrate-binding protein
MYQTSADLSDPKVKRLMAAFAAKYKDPFNATLITGYDMSVMLFDAIVKVQSLDARKIAPVLADMKGNGTFGPLEFGGQAYYGIKRQPLFSFFLGRVEKGVEKIVTKLQP